MSTIIGIFTEIQSNGSKWYGQEPDTIDELLEVLKTETIEDRFFSKTYYSHHDKWLTRCPISKEGDIYHFFGNFEQLSHVFNIRTNDPVIIDKLKNAIMNNEGYKKHKVNLKEKKVHHSFCSWMA